MVPQYPQFGFAKLLRLVWKGVMAGGYVLSSADSNANDSGIIVTSETVRKMLEMYAFGS